MRLRLCGVRGSTPAPGAAFTRVGGHTPCVAVWPDALGAPRLVLDAGTGIRAVSDLLGGAPFHGTVLLSHLHWDHVQGLPFFAAGDRDDARVALLLPREGAERHVAGATARDVLARAMSPPHFPIGPEGLRGSWRFDAVDEGWHDLEGLRVLAREVPHKGGRTFGYRVEGGGGSFAYLPDHRPVPGNPAHDALRELVDRVDVLVHDAQFLASERATAVAYGHATVEEACALACDARARELVLFHHAPARTDDELDALRESLARGGLAVTVAVEGMERTIPGS